MSYSQQLATNLPMRKLDERAKAKAPEVAIHLSHSFASLMHGYTWIGSEGDDLFRAFSAPFAPATILEPETFRAAAGIAESWKITIEPAAPWFAKMIQYFHDGQYGSEDDHAIEMVYTHLQAVMNATLEDPLRLASVHYAPSGGSTTFHKARYYIFGQVAEGGLAGVMAQSVET